MISLFLQKDVRIIPFLFPSKCQRAGIKFAEKGQDKFHELIPVTGKTVDAIAVFYRNAVMAESQIPDSSFKHGGIHGAPAFGFTSCHGFRESGKFLCSTAETQGRSMIFDLHTFLIEINDDMFDVFGPAGNAENQFVEVFHKLYFPLVVGLMNETTGGS